MPRRLTLFTFSRKSVAAVIHTQNAIMPRVRLTWPYGCQHLAMVAGSWAQWQPQILVPSKINKPGQETTEIWSTEIQLPDNVVVSEYRYKFIVDGDWRYDPAQPFLSNAYDSFDNFVKVSIMNERSSS